jgi:hypothetical protein
MGKMEQKLHCPKEIIKFNGLSPLWVMPAFSLVKGNPLKNLFLFLLVALVTAGCGGFGLKSLSPSSAQPNSPAPDPVPSLSYEAELNLSPESFPGKSPDFVAADGLFPSPTGPIAEAEITKGKPLSDNDSEALASPVGGGGEKEVFPFIPEPSEENSAVPSPNPSPFPSLAHGNVEYFIGFFQKKGDAFFTRSLGQSTAYAEMMKGIFREKNLPEELIYLALIESGYNPKAFSRAKASGIWQFTKKTARRFGLKIDKWVDERRDPEKATYAAAEYLKSLYAMFNDWDLAIASYNAGEGKVSKAMRKADSQDFWDISRHRFLKKETKEYVPMFFAAVTIAQDPQKYGFQNIEYSPPLVYEKVTAPPATNLTKIAKAARSDLRTIQALNPMLLRGKTPPHASFEIKVPPGNKEVFERNILALTKPSANNKKHRPQRTMPRPTRIALQK